MTNAARLRHLARHPYRDEIIGFLLGAAYWRPHASWRVALATVAIEMERKIEAMERARWAREWNSRRRST